MRHRVNILLSEDEHNEIREAAQREGLSLSSAVRLAALRWCRQRKRVRDS